MGVQGLTTYITQNSDKFLETFQLKDSYLVIDGNNLASNLYKWVCKCNNAFGGDYDRYAHCVKEFFVLLRKCNVTPVVLLDGGYEVRKLRTVNERLMKKLCDAKRVKPSLHLKSTVFPLFMKEVFKEVMSNMKIMFAQCEFEADQEIAAVARFLGCAVLSYDSDFFIYDVLYIPFDTVSLEPLLCESSTEDQRSFYISCKIYKIENFLNSFGGVQKTFLPLVATLLGNDYTKRSIFSNFFSQIKIPKNRAMSYTQRHIAGLLSWLRVQSLKGAVDQILSYIRTPNRKFVEGEIRRNIEDYACKSSKTLSYLQFNLKSHTSNESYQPLLLDAISKPSFIGNVQEVAKLSAHEINLKRNENINTTECFNKVLPCKFKESFHKGNLPPCFMDILTLNTYFCLPQVEDFSLPHSHEVSLPILRVIFGLLMSSINEKECITLVSRDDKTRIKRFTLTPICSLPSHIHFPSLEALPELSHLERKSILLETVGFDSKDEEALKDYPDEWTLFIIGLVFWCRNSSDLSMMPSLVSAILMTMINLQVIDHHAGYYRSRSLFLRERGGKVKKVCKRKHVEADKSTSLEENENNQTSSAPDKLTSESNASLENDSTFSKLSNCNVYSDKKHMTITDALKFVSPNDCLLLVETFIPFHQVEDALKNNPKLFSISVVHAFARLQSCLLHIMYLNGLLDHPFAKCNMSKFFSGTILYNLSMNFRKRSDLNLYVAHLIGHASTVHNLYIVLHRSLEALLAKSFSLANKPRRKRNRKPKRKTAEITEEFNDSDTQNSNSEEDTFMDVNNKFFILNALT